jgi:hypothetical protein
MPHSDAWAASHVFTSSAVLMLFIKKAHLYMIMAFHASPPSSCSALPLWQASIYFILFYLFI